jgi:hypothetical protein
MKFDRQGLPRGRETTRRSLASISHISRRLNDCRRRFIVMPETASELFMIEQAKETAQ